GRYGGDLEDGVWSLSGNILTIKILRSNYDTGGEGPMRRVRRPEIRKIRVSKRPSKPAPSGRTQRRHPHAPPTVAGLQRDKSLCPPEASLKPQKILPPAPKREEQVDLIQHQRFLGRLLALGCQQRRVAPADIDLRRRFAALAQAAQLVGGFVGRLARLGQGEEAVVVFAIGGNRGLHLAQGVQHLAVELRQRAGGIGFGGADPGAGAGAGEVPADQPGDAPA
ncbi:hypothetical protein E4T56_gene14271, partial [Termitomyces sp. T112]